MIAIKHCIVNEQSRKQVVICACLKLYIKDTIIALILAFKNLICPHGWPDNFNIQCFLIDSTWEEQGQNVASFLAYPVFKGCIILLRWLLLLLLALPFPGFCHNDMPSDPLLI